MLGLKSWIKAWTRKTAPWTALSQFDHAFANSLVFPRPASIDDALEMLQGDEAVAEMLMAVFTKFEENAVLGPDVRLSLNARLINLNARESVTIGGSSVIRGLLRNEERGRLSIGNRVYIGDNVIVSAASSIEIADGTLLAHGVQIFDNDSHPVDAREREAHFSSILGDKSGPSYTIASAPVRIGRLSWIGLNAVVMKGVTIGDEVIIAAGSVVTRDVSSKTAIGGNPAATIKQL